MHTVKIVGQSATKGELPIRTDDDGNLIIQLEGATVNIGDVDVASIAAGTNLIGKVGIDQATDHANEVVVKTLAAPATLPLPTGAANAANQALELAELEGIAAATEGLEPRYVDIGSPIRITGNAASQQVTVPAGAKSFACFAEGGAVRCEIGGAASATSTIYVEEAGFIDYPILGGTQTLYCYCAVGVFGNFRFLGLPA